MNKVEEYIRDYTRACSNEMDFKENGKPVYHPWLIPDHARAVAQIARQEVIDKACEWLKALNDEHQVMSYTDSHTLDTDELTGYFKNFMEDEE